MNKKLRTFIAIGFCLCLIIVLGLATLAFAQSDATPSPLTSGSSTNNAAPAAPVPGGPGFVSLSPFVIKPYTASSSYAYTNQSLYNPGGTIDYYMGAIQLPNGATITKVVMYYLDNGSSDITLDLLACPLASKPCSIMATLFSADASTEIRSVETTVITTPVIDLQNNTYAVDVLLPPTAIYQLVGVRVDYGYPQQLPLINK